MKPEKLENMVLPIKRNGKIQNLKDEIHGENNFESSCYLNGQKMLLKGQSNWSEKKSLIMCIKLGTKLVKCNAIY
jgi:hypothetical protein